MRGRSVDDMRSYWDDRARKNAAWYVDTSLGYDQPDMGRFFETGREIARIVLDGPVQPERKELAVEIGPGLGRICRALSDEFDRVVGVDISEEMVQRARELVDDPSITFEVGDGASLAPVNDGAADLVVSFTVFQHIPEPEVIEAYILEAGRVLRTGGVFAFQWNNAPGHRRWALRRVLLSWLQRTGLRGERYERNAPQFLGSRVPLPRIDAALGAAGLERVGSTGEGTLYCWAWARKP